jgi:hypothetical protein
MRSEMIRGDALLALPPSVTLTVETVFRVETIAPALARVQVTCRDRRVAQGSRESGLADAHLRIVD